MEYINVKTGTTIVTENEIVEVIGFRLENISPWTH